MCILSDELKRAKLNTNNKEEKIMRISIHDVYKIKVSDIENLPSSKSRTLYIQSDKEEIQIVLFNSDADKLKVFNLDEDESL